MAAIAGVSPYAGPLSVYMRIVEGVGSEDSAHSRRGTRLEGPVLDWYEEETRRTVQRKVSLRDSRTPHLRASVDALSWEGEGEDSPARVVEAKTANGSVAHRWGEEGTDEIPAEYLCQTQWYMGRARATGYAMDDVADVPALVAGDFRLYRVGFDAETFGLLYETVDRFWVDHVLARKPPEPTALSRDGESVRKRFRHQEGEQPLDYGALSPEAQATLEEYLRAYQDEAAASERRAIWEARAQLVLGAAPGVDRLPESLGFKRIDWKAQKGKTAWKAVAEALAKQCGVSEAQLRALAAENTGEGARPFVPRPTTKRGTK